MSAAPLRINGWDLYAHPLFLDQFAGFVTEVEKAKSRDPAGYRNKRAAKLLAAVRKVAFEVIPQDPSRPAYRQGGTLGPEHRHWFRAKFLQQYRLFFRYRVAGERQIIVLAWVNDETTLRAYESSRDAYAVFRAMLGRGHPPDDWDALLAEAAAAADRLARLGDGEP
ncbi:toxin [Methylobacterium sp. Leaf456]|uniref:type II toxin-antitoxin system YhaV family toxin n=1 Tax=Methylobacterium sp. Leaf456 TaxID=1736382 RepID=UPI000700DFD7|nr:type II toxin-antitoxin system YhaV family toxin [Methylobacterium sp. Leaf456]KQT46487.1 toxin [Methylobacterium sp. Leaf456]